MANEDFGLGFTTSDVAIWVEDSEGKIGLESTIQYPFTFADISKVGLESTIFFPFTALDSQKIGLESTILSPFGAVLNKIGMGTTVDASGICYRQNFLSPDQNPANVNSLAGPGQNNMSTC